MARNRQRAKERQAQRRAERLEGGDIRVSRESNGDEAEREQDRARAEIATGAPPSDTGRSDTLLAPRTEAPPDARPAGEPLVVPDTTPEHDHPLVPDEQRRGGRVMGFLAAVVAELRRVQWPDRTALTTMTGVVLGFVVIAGGYLGLLDYIFSRLVRAII